MLVILLEVDPVEEELLDGGVAHVDVAGEDVEVGEYLLVSFKSLGLLPSLVFIESTRFETTYTGRT